MTRTLTLLFGFGCFLLAGDPVTNSRHADLPAGGTIRLKHSTGELNHRRMGSAQGRNHDH
jgi:hypothetical protein